MVLGVRDVTRLRSFPPGFPARRVLGASVVHHLLAEYVYDVGVAQVLTGDQLARTDLSSHRWRVEQVAADRFLVAHRQPERWFNPSSGPLREGTGVQPFIDPHVLDLARADFANALLTVDVVKAHSPHLSSPHRDVVMRWLTRP